MCHEKRKKRKKRLREKSEKKEKEKEGEKKALGTGLSTPKECEGNFERDDQTMLMIQVRRA